MIRLVSAPPEGLCPPAAGFGERVDAFGAAYDYRSDFCRFYTDERGTTRLFWRDGLAYLSLLPSGDPAAAAELAARIASGVVSDTPLSLDGFSLREGLRFVGKPPAAPPLTGVTASPEAAFLLLREGFPQTVRPARFPDWYTDLSHRMRHGMTKLFVLPGLATVTMDRLPGGVFLSQLTTAAAARGRGLASALIAHGAGAFGAETVWVDSQTRSSDGFYRALGFREAGHWYCYERIEQEN